jgi:hypothetical protein
MSLRDFQDVLTDVGDGTLHAQLTEKLPEVVRAVTATKKAGKIVLTLDVRCENNMVVVKGGVKATLPQPTIDATMFYADDAGNITRDNPRQLQLKRIVKDAARAGITAGTVTSTPAAPKE